MVKRNELAETDKRADLLRSNPRAMSHAQDYARRVARHEGLQLKNLETQQVDISVGDLDTGDE